MSAGSTRGCVEMLGSEYRGPLTVKQFDGGQSNPTYLLQTAACKYVLRRKPPGVLLKSAHAVDREFRVLSALAKHGFPVPEPLALCEDESVIGTMFYVMRHVEGRIFWDCAMPDLAPTERAAIFDSVNETLAKLASARPCAVWGCRISGDQATTSLVRSRAGASSINWRRRTTSWR